MAGSLLTAQAQTNFFQAPSPLSYPFYRPERKEIRDYTTRTPEETYFSGYEVIGENDTGISKQVHRGASLISEKVFSISELKLVNDFRIQYSDSTKAELDALLKKLWVQKGLLGHIKDFQEFQFTPMGNQLINIVGDVRASQILRWLLVENPSLDELRLISGIDPVHLKNYPVLYRFGSLRDPPSFSFSQSVIHIPLEAYARVNDVGMPAYTFERFDTPGIFSSRDVDTRLLSTAQEQADDFALQRFKDLIAENKRDVFTDSFLKELHLISQKIPLNRQMWFVTVDWVTGEVESVFSIMDGTRYSSFEDPVRMAVEHSLNKELIDPTSYRRVFEIRRLAGKKLSKGALARTARILVQHINYLNYRDDTLFLLQTDEHGGNAFKRFGFSEFTEAGEIPPQYRVMSADAATLKAENPVVLVPKGRHAMLDPLNLSITANPKHRYSLSNCGRYIIGSRRKRY